MHKETVLDFLSAEDLADWGGYIANQIAPGTVIFLHGPLGAGKTTLVRGFLRGLGYQGNVKSPTYTLVETYPFGQLNVYHFDLYRLLDPEELALIGIRDFFNDDSICLIEWPDKGSGLLPKPDLTCYIDFHPEGRRVKVMNNLNHLELK